MTKKTMTELRSMTYTQRLSDLQRRYLGLHKNLSRTRHPRQHGGAGGYVPGSEAEKVYLSGRY